MTSLLEIFVEFGVENLAQDLRIYILKMSCILSYRPNELWWGGKKNQPSISWMQIWKLKQILLLMFNVSIFKLLKIHVSSVQFSCSVMSDSLRPHESQHTKLPVHHQLPEFTQTHIHQVSDAIQPSLPRSSPSPPAPNPSQHQSLFQWVNSSHEVAKVLEFQL